MIRHVPVLAKEICETLPENLNCYLDGTLGHGGHVQYILDYFHGIGKNDIKVIGVDRDKDILTKTKGILKNYNNIVYFNESYCKIDTILNENGTDRVDFVLLDLGVNMEHFKDYSRGFSIKADADLDMRFDKSQTVTAAHIIQDYSVEKLQKMLIIYGDFTEKGANILAEGIVNARQNKAIKSTFQLKDLLTQLHLNQKKIAVIFQCLRIEVNNELEQLEIFLKKFSSYISKGGRCSIITYHSIEDRIVKNAFKELSENGNFVLVNKHVIKPHYTEVMKNKAARSAKLRIIQAL